MTSTNSRPDRNGAPPGRRTRGTRRGNNEGSIAKRPNGKWQAQLRIGTRRVYQSFDSRREAQAWLRQAAQQREQGTFLAPQRISLAAYLARWLDTIRPTVQPKTFKSYSDLVRIHIAPALGHIPLDQLHPMAIQSFYANRLAAGLSKRTVQYLHAVLRRALNMAIKWGLLAHNPALATEPPRPDKRTMQVFTAADARQFLTAIRQHRLFALFLLAIVTGMRQGELLGLHWDDIDSDLGVVHIRHSLSEVTGQPLTIKTTKSATGRVVPLPAVVLAALDEHRRRQAEERALMGWPRSPLVFVSEAGTPLHKGPFRGTWKRLIARAGVPDIRFHDLRHTAASLLFARRVHPKIVQEALGHSSIALTMDLYSHLLPHVSEEVAQQMQTLFGDGDAIDVAALPAGATER